MKERARQRASALLFFALLPSLLFLGHWGLSLSLPLLDVELVLLPGDGHIHESAEVPGHAHENGSDEADAHARHCHGGAATCSDVPYAGASGFALVAETVALLGGAPTVANCGEMTGLAALYAPGPDPRPPQALVECLLAPTGRASRSST